MKMFQLIILSVSVTLVTSFENVFAVKVECPPVNMIKAQILKNERTQTGVSPWFLKSDSFSYQGRQFFVEFGLSESCARNIIEKDLTADDNITKLQNFFSKTAKLKQETQLHWSDDFSMADYCMCTYDIENEEARVDVKTSRKNDDGFYDCRAN